MKGIIYIHKKFLKLKKQKRRNKVNMAIEKKLITKKTVPENLKKYFPFLKIFPVLRGDNIYTQILNLLLTIIFNLFLA